MLKPDLNRVKSNTFVLMIIIVICKLLGMLRDIVLANCYGTSSVSDAYLIATAIPVYLFHFIGHSLSTAYLPIFNKVLKDDGKPNAYKYTHELIGCALLLCMFIFLVLLCFPSFFAKIFANGFDDNTNALTARLIRFCAVDLFLMVIINVWGGFLQANNNFIIPASVSIPRNIIIIISIYISTIAGVDCLGIGMVIAYLSEALLLLPYTIKDGLKPKLQFNFKSSDVKETVYFALPVVVGVSVTQINAIIDRSMASNITVGGVSALNYASVINNAIQEIIVTGIVSILFARCAVWVAEGKMDTVKEKLNDTIDMLSFFLIPSVFGVVACSKYIVKVVLCRGAFDEISLSLTNGCLVLYTVGLPFFAFRDVISKVFYALKDSKTPMVTSIISVIINIVLNFILSYFLSIKGLALASSISALVQFVIIFLCLRKKIGGFSSWITFFNVIKSFLAAIIMFIGVKFLLFSLEKIEIPSLIVLLVAVFSGVAIYCIISILIHNQTFTKLKEYILNKINFNVKS